MNQPATRNPRSAGALLALLLILGGLIGALTHEPSLGIVLGGAIGVAICLALWIVDRRRQG